MFKLIRTPYTCDCCSLETIEKYIAVTRQSFNVGDKVRDWCKVVGEKREGTIIRLKPERRFCVVKFGKHKSDEKVRSFDELEKIEL
jgi:hypothetical protein